jgi:hypothetical protein
LTPKNGVDYTPISLLPNEQRLPVVVQFQKTYHGSVETRRNREKPKARVAAIGPQKGARPKYKLLRTQILP